MCNTCSKNQTRLITMEDERVGVQVKLFEIPREHVPYLNASEVMFHEEALYLAYLYLYL